MGRGDDDVEFFELADDGQVLADPPAEPGSVETGRPSDRLSATALAAQIRAVPPVLRLGAVLCVVAAALGGFAAGRSGRSGPVARAIAPLSSSASNASAAISSAPIGSAQLDPSQPGESQPGESSAASSSGVTSSCRGVSDVVVSQAAPLNLVQTLYRHLPQVVIDAGSSVTNELGTACVASVSGHLGTDRTQINLTVTAPAIGYHGTGSATINGQGLYQGFEAQFITPDGWTVDATAQFGSTSTLIVELGELVTDPRLIVRAASS